MFTLVTGNGLQSDVNFWARRRDNVMVRFVLVTFLLTGCASSSGLVSQTIEGGPGQPISVDIAAVDNAVTIEDPDHSRQYTVQVEVSNISDVPLTVGQIAIRTGGSGAFQVSPTVQRFNEMIDPGKDHLFDMIVRGRFARALSPGEPRTVILNCIVTLTNGDSYAYNFEGPVREVP